MNKFKQIALFYIDGFRGMTTGKTLWMIILIKLFIMFVILRIFFFKPYLKQYGDAAQQEEQVSRELVERGR